MIRTITLLASASALALAACSDDSYETDTDTDMDTSAEMNSAMGDEADGETDGELDEGMRYESGEDAADDDLGQSPPVNFAQDTASVPAGLTAAVVAGLSGDVDAYVRNVALGNEYEIQAGRIAMERGNSEEVRQLGEMIAADHEQLQTELRTAVEAAGLDFDLPTELEGRRQGMIDNLNAAADMDFDAAFLSQQESAHVEAVALHEGFEASGDVDALTDYAGTAGNVVQGHLDEVTAHLGAAVDGD